ncbi:MAG: M23 family metallopeptidase [Meiothermus sp.]|nr:M23 family metallopeptidase [Meiothermus sp.]
MRFLALLIFVCLTAQAQVPGNPQQPELLAEQIDGGAQVFVNNPLYAPVSATFTVGGTNFSSSAGSSFVRVLPPRARTLVLTVKPADPQAAWNWSFSWSWRMGDINARPDGTVYDLPFATGAAFRVDQGYGGVFSHNTAEGRYALDFNMPEGTPVHAAREGVVVALETGFTAGGTDPALRAKANYIAVLHADGTIAEYVHLRAGGSAVRVGQQVARGQLIGYSGNTGYSSTPHLHFHVYRALSPTGGWQTLAVQFRTLEGGPLSLQEGQRYTRP